MKKFVLFLIGSVLMTLAGSGESSSLPTIPIYPIGGSIAPYVDKDGYVNPIVNLGYVNFGKGVVLPLVLNFSTAIRPPSPEFGQGWDCPLFESKIFDVQQNIKKVELLGGKDIYLIHNARDDTWKHFYSDDWKGEAKGDDFELTYVSGCKFTYHKGLISSLTLPDGRFILWNRTGDKLDSMQEIGKSPSLSVIYDKLGFAQQILLNPDNLGQAQLTYDFHSSLVYAGIDKIQYPGNRAVSFNQAPDKSGNPTLAWTDAALGPMTLSWNKKTGKILSDNRYDYQMTEVATDMTWPRISRTNKVTGQVESYYYDQARGITDETLPDGTVRHIEMIVAPGPNYKMVRLIEDQKNGVTQTTLRRAFDDQGHLLQEAFGLAHGEMQVKQYTYDSSGRIVSYLFNGKEMWKNIYDTATGQLKERILPDLKVNVSFEALPGGEIKESIKRTAGALVSVKTLPAQEWAKTESDLQNIQ